MKRRVVITGMGALSPLGVGVEASWKACLEARSGIRRITKFDSSPYRSQIGGELDEFDRSAYLDRKEARRYDDFTQYALVASQMAVDDANLRIDQALQERMGVIVGTGVGGLLTFDNTVRTFQRHGPKRLSPFALPMFIANMGSGAVALRFGVRGPSSCVVTACSSASHAIGDAFKVIQRGQADVMLAGGSDACMTEFALACFDAMRALSSRNEEPDRASRPFDQNRDGFVLSEGAAMLLLEDLEHARSRGARIYGEIAGYGLSNDAHHFTAPDPNGGGASLCMRMALEDASISPEEVDYINAHGTSTPLNDVIETRAIKAVFGDHVNKLAISSTKSMTGHMLGAAGALEAVFSCLTLRQGIIPPTVNHEKPDDECDLDYVPNQARAAEVRCVLSNSFGFGGANACLAFKAINGTVNMSPSQN